ncbi:MAG TPA: response regulator [Stellaceae bacterium]|jgi:DNA-binding response OmpR family regulator|nr:response regulator [Stellaceae bacterium]
MPHILLVEDDTAVRLVFLEILFDVGYEVDAAGSYETGAALLDSGAAFDLLITDRRFPDGSGLTLAAQASAMGVPVLVVTGDTTGLEQASHAVLAKPMRPDAFLSAVQAILASKA